MAQVALHVSLLAHTPCGGDVVARASRLCYSASRIADLDRDVEQSGGAEAYLDRLMSLGHLSPVEHASFTFGVEGVSRALLAQITRHRIASFSVQSQRYVKNTELDYVIPPSIQALGEEAAAEYREQMKTLHGWYLSWLERTGGRRTPGSCCPRRRPRMILTMNAGSDPLFPAALLFPPHGRSAPGLGLLGLAKARSRCCSATRAALRGRCSEAK